MMTAEDARRIIAALRWLREQDRYDVCGRVELVPGSWHDSTMGRILLGECDELGNPAEARGDDEGEAHGSALGQA